MPTRFFLLPSMIEGTVIGPAHIRWAYPGGIANEGTGLDVEQFQPYTLTGSTMACAVDADASVLLSLNDETDTFGFDTLDETMPALERDELDNFLDDNGMPSGWIEAWTRRTILRAIVAMYHYLRELANVAGNPIEWGITWMTVFSTIDAAYRSAIRGTFSSLGYDSSVILDSWTVRRVLKEAAVLGSASPISFGFVDL